MDCPVCSVPWTMDRSCPIEVIDLLHEREVEFMRIWRCEREIRELLSLDSFPFPAPPELPSMSRPAKAAPRPKAQEKSDASSGVDIRKLERPGENAYRLVYQYNGSEGSSFQNDRDVVRMLAGMRARDFTLLSVEAVSFTDMEHWTVSELLWKRGSETDG